ncbi:MAG: hypothetical protein ABIH90_01645 [Candidatus Aenigmatarchaeota archaeon]
MEEASIDAIVAKAKDYHSKGKSWHFHMLTPDCVFNKKHKHAFVLENRSDNQTFVAYSDKRHMDAGQELVRLLHGDEILQPSHGTKTGSKIDGIIETCKELNRKNQHWHHHMFFPDCIFNEHKGKWSIVFEDKTTGNILTALYGTEPTNDLRRIEVLFYAQNESTINASKT